MVTAGSRFISPKTGIIKEILELSIEQDDPLIYAFGTLMSDTRCYSPHQCGTRNGGAGLTRDQAFMAAVGETIERYCSNFYNRDQFVFASYNELASPAIHPERFILYSAAQYARGGFPFEPFTEESRVCWTLAYSLTESVPKLVPASFVYLPYAYSNGEAAVAPSISTGLACGESTEAAILTGLYECVERDAFIIMWLNALSMPVVDIRDGQSSLSRLFGAKFGLSNIDYCVSEITSDVGIPSYFVLATGNSSMGMLACVGSATRLDASQAIQKALVETGQARPYLRYVLRKEPDWTCGEGFSNIRTFDDHARLYSTLPELIPHLEFVRRAPSRSTSDLPNLSTGSVAGDIEACVTRLAAKGLEVLAVDLTTREVAEVGFRVVRIIVPGLHPLHGNHHYPFLGGNRLYQLPRTLGYAEHDTSEDSLNPWPHPFP
jgi:ribosomal protein S12 methylthiotransferase accessory factor